MPVVPTYSQYKIDELLNTKEGTLTFDTTPTADSTNPVTSNGIKVAIDTEATARTTADNTLQTNINTKQDTLVSGTNIKTIGGVSVLGSGDIPAPTSAEFSGSNTQLNGLTINGTNYKLLDVKVNNGSSLIIGKNRSLASGANNAVAIGDCDFAMVSGIASTALGDSSTASGSYSTAIGYYSRANNTYSTALGRYSVAIGN